MKIIYIIDDQEDLLDMFEFYFSMSDFDPTDKVIYLTSFKFCHPRAGDVVLHDLSGVDYDGIKIPGVKYYTHSGVFSIHKEQLVDFPKPGNMTEIVTFLVDKYN